MVDSIQPAAVSQPLLSQAQESKVITWIKQEMQTCTITQDDNPYLHSFFIEVMADARLQNATAANVVQTLLDVMEKTLCDLCSEDLLLCLNGMEKVVGISESEFVKLVAAFYDKFLELHLTPQNLEAVTLSIKDSDTVDISVKRVLEEHLRQKLFLLLDEKNPKLQEDEGRLLKLLEHNGIGTLDKALKSLLEAYSTEQRTLALREFMEEVCEAETAKATNKTPLSLYQQYLKALITHFIPSFQVIVVS